MSVNKATLLGNITKDLELKTFGDSGMVVGFSLACNYTYKNKQGEWVEGVDYVDCTLFGKRAEALCKYAKKGSKIYVEGAIKTQKYEKDGQTRYSTKVHVDTFEFCSGAPKKEEENWEGTPVPPAPSTPAYPADDINPDEIPF